MSDKIKELLAGAIKRKILLSLFQNSQGLPKRQMKQSEATYRLKEASAVIHVNSSHQPANKPDSKPKLFL